MTKGARKGESLEMRSDGWKDNTRAEKRTCLFRGREKENAEEKKKKKVEEEEEEEEKEEEKEGEGEGS